MERTDRRILLLRSAQRTVRAGWIALATPPATYLMLGAADVLGLLRKILDVQLRRALVRGGSLMCYSDAWSTFE